MWSACSCWKKNSDADVQLQIGEFVMEVQLSLSNCWLVGRQIKTWILRVRRCVNLHDLTYEIEP